MSYREELKEALTSCTSNEDQYRELLRIRDRKEQELTELRKPYVIPAGQNAFLASAQNFGKVMVTEAELDCIEELLAEIKGQDVAKRETNPGGPPQTHQG